MRFAQSHVAQPSAPATPGPAAPGGPTTQWGPLLAIIAFVVVSSVVLGAIGWKKRDS